jgi:PRTRC genetic system protein E
MLNASQIKGLIPEGGSLILNIAATKEGKLSVLVNPQCPEKSTPNLGGAAWAIKAATAPRLVTGTPEELDNGFMALDF